MTTVAQTMEHNNNGGDSIEDNASALLAVPCLHMLPQRWQQHEQQCATTKGGNGVDDDALAALSAIPCSLVQWGSQQQCKQQCAITTVGVARMMVP